LTLIFGQILAFLMSGSGVFTQLLQINYNIDDIPTSQSFPNYILLFLTFGVALACRGDIDRVIREHWWKYILITILDVETNYIYVAAYQYTTIASAQVCIQDYACVQDILYVRISVLLWLLNGPYWVKMTQLLYEIRLLPHAS